MSKYLCFFLFAVKGIIKGFYLKANVCSYYLTVYYSFLLQRVRKADMGDAVILDADCNTVETPFNDLESLPVDVVNSLKRQLRSQISLGDGVSRAFLRALVQLIGGYRDAL